MTFREMPSGKHWLWMRVTQKLRVVFACWHFPESHFPTVVKFAEWIPKQKHFQARRRIQRSGKWLSEKCHDAKADYKSTEKKKRFQTRQTITCSEKWLSGKCNQENIGCECALHKICAWYLRAGIFRKVIFQPLWSSLNGLQSKSISKSGDVYSGRENDFPKNAMMQRLIINRRRKKNASKRGKL